MIKRVVALMAFIYIFISCKKLPGEGGFASIEGKVYVKNYDATFTIKSSEYYLPGETVYIIYGTGTEIGNTVKTSYDGSFKFNYLRKGDYKVYVLGKDSSKAYLSVPKETLQNVSITTKKQKVILTDLEIIK
jgi:hypothetical protein